jgi:peptidyl-prolyl cis-trans isomerase C
MKTFRALSVTALLLSTSAFAATPETTISSEAVIAPTESETVVVRVNDQEITQGDIQQMADRMLQQFQMQGRPVTEEIKAQAYRTAEDNMITEKLIEIAIAESEIVITDEAVNETIEKLKSSIPEGMDFDSALAAQGISLTELKENIATDMAARQLFDTKITDVDEVTEADALAFYNSNLQNFQVEETVSASHILIPFEPGDSDEAKATKKAELEAIRADIIAGNTTFEDAAKAHSGCPSSAQGGSLGEFGKGQMVPEFEVAAFSQDLDTVGEVIETSFGYHIIKVTEHEEVGVTPFAEVKEAIINYLTQNANAAAAQAYIQNLHDAATIEYVKPE